MTARFKVKLLNGPLRGREVRLPDGEWKIGGRNSDFAVDLEDGAQAVFEIGDEGVMLSGSAPYWIKGKRGRYPAGPLPLDVPIEIAGLGIVLGEIDSTLGDVKLPTRRSTRRRMMVVCAGAGSLIVLSALIASAIVILPPNFRMPPADSDKLVGGIQAELGPEGVKVSHQGNVVILSGACGDRDKVELARRDLVRQGLSVVNQVICEDDLIQTVTGILQLYGLTGVKVTGGAVSGDVVFSGRVSSDPKWSTVANVLAATPGLVNWRVSDPAVDATHVLADQLRTAGIIDDLTVLRTGEVILVTGELDSGARQKLVVVLKDFRRAHPAGPRVVYQDIAPYLPLDRIFPSPLVTIGGNQERAFALLANGDRLQVGDVLPSGFQVTRIHQFGVDVVRAGEFVHAAVRANSR
jgi:type III secretion protein D